MTNCPKQQRAQLAVAADTNRCVTGLQALYSARAVRAAEPQGRWAAWISGMTRTERETLTACRDAIRPLVDRGFREVRATYDGRRFGNVLIDLESPNLRVRLTRDRGQYFIDVSKPADDEWFDTHTVLIFLGASAEANALADAGWPSPHRVAELVAKHFPSIAAAFADSRYAETVEALHGIERKSALDRFGYEAPPN